MTIHLEHKPSSKTFHSSEMRLGKPGALRAVAMTSFNRDAVVKPTKTFFFKTSLLSLLLCWCMVTVVAEVNTKALTTTLASALKPAVTAQTSTTSTKNTGDRPSCPPGCFCDWNASLLSCSGPEDDDDEESHELMEDQDDDNLYRNKGIAVDSMKENTHTNEGEKNDYVWPAAASASVQRLDLRHLVVARLDAIRLNGTDELLELSVVLCGLESIANGTFIRHGRLERLDLSQNRIANLTRDMLIGLVQLRSVDLSSNRLTSIDNGALEALPSLEQVNLRANRLVAIGPDAFKGLNRLQFLNVAGNNISHMAENAFQQLTQLAHLIISRNPLDSLQHVDLLASRPAYIDLSSSGLRRIPSFLARCCITDLRLSGNNFGRLEMSDFESVPQVRLLVLDDSNITSIADDTFGRLEQLERLSLNGNSLTNVPSNLPSAGWLTALYLDGNRISTLHSSDFDGQQRLDQLHLARNVIDSIAMGAFHSLTSLTRLDLRSNRLRHVSRDVFSGLVRLRLLDLSDNPLVLVRAEVDSLRHLNAVVRVIISPNQQAAREQGDQLDEAENGASLTMGRTSAATDGGTQYQHTRHQGKNDLVPTTISSTASVKKGSGGGDKRASSLNNNGVANEDRLMALAVVLATLLSLSVLIGVLFITAGRSRRPSLTEATEVGERERIEIGVSVPWRTGRRRRQQHSRLGAAVASHTTHKDAVKLGWVPAEDFDQWSQTLFHQTETEHERLLLAVSPHQ